MSDQPVAVDEQSPLLEINELYQQEQEQQQQQEQQRQHLHLHQVHSAKEDRELDQRQCQDQPKRQEQQHLVWQGHPLPPSPPHHSHHQHQHRMRTSPSPVAFISAHTASVSDIIQRPPQAPTSSPTPQHSPPSEAAPPAPVSSIYTNSGTDVEPRRDTEVGNDHGREMQPRPYYISKQFGLLHEDRTNVMRSLDAPLVPGNLDSSHVNYTPSPAGDSNPAGDRQDAQKGSFFFNSAAAPIYHASLSHKTMGPSGAATYRSWASVAGSVQGTGLSTAIGPKDDLLGNEAHSFCGPDPQIDANHNSEITKPEIDVREREQDDDRPSSESPSDVEGTESDRSSMARFLMNRSSPAGGAASPGISFHQPFLRLTGTPEPPAQTQPQLVPESVWNDPAHFHFPINTDSTRKPPTLFFAPLQTSLPHFQMNPPSVMLLFTVPVATVDGLDSNYAVVQSSLTETVQQICDDAAATAACQITFSIADVSITQQHKGSHIFNFTISILGSPEQAAVAKGIILRRNPSQTILTVKALKKALLRTNGEMKSSVKAKLDEIMTQTKTQITCVSQGPTETNTSGIQSEIERMDLEIMGTWHAAERARLRCLTLLDHLAGHHWEHLEIESELHPVISGRKRAFVKSVMQEHSVNIYFPSPLAGIFAPSTQNQSTGILISGHQSSVEATRELLRNAANIKRQSLLRKAVTCLPQKLDWSLVNARQKIQKIMIDNAVFISFPTIGSGQGLCLFSGEDPVYIERAIRAFMLLMCDTYFCEFQVGSPSLSPIAFGKSLEAIRGIPPDVFITISSQSVELFGVQSSVKSTFSSFSGLPLLQTVGVREYKFRLELALEHKEFLNGKKNGKINKIIKASGSRVMFFETFNEYNMLIDLANATEVGALDGLSMLEDELPGEISFFIPEIYHKRIIGVGGKNIQRIMKKYGVYVKFSNAEEFSSLGGYFENTDNVIARTPAKNSANLLELKDSILELINMKDDALYELRTEVPWQLQGKTIGFRGAHLREIEQLYNVQIIFPEREEGTDLVIVKGDRTRAEQAANNLQQLTPLMFDFQIPATNAAHNILTSVEFHDLTARLSQENEIEMQLYFPRLLDFGQDFSFTLLAPRRRADRFEVFKKGVVEYLVAKQVPLEATSSLHKSGSYANLAPQKSYDSFQHFNSKLLSPTPVADPQMPSNPSNYSLFNQGSGPFIPPRSSRVSGPQSVPNLRDLFDNPRSVPPGENISKRSQSDLSMEPTTRILAATLAATSLSGSNTWYSPIPDASPMFAHTTMAPPRFTHTPDAEYAKSDVEQRVSLYESSEMGLKVPNDKFCGLALSRSVPNTAIEDQTSRKSSPRPTRLSNLMIESPLGSSEAARPTFGAEVADQILSMPNGFSAVELLLDSLDLAGYKQLFADQQVDVNVLLTMNDSDLRELGLKAFGPRKKLVNAIRDCIFIRQSGQVIVAAAAAAINGGGAGVGNPTGARPFGSAGKINSSVSVGSGTTGGVGASNTAFAAAPLQQDTLRQPLTPGQVRD